MVDTWSCIFPLFISCLLHFVCDIKRPKSEQTMQFRGRWGLNFPQKRLWQHPALGIIWAAPGWAPPLGEAFRLPHPELVHFWTEFGLPQISQQVPSHGFHTGEDHSLHYPRASPQGVPWGSRAPPSLPNTFFSTPSFCSILTLDPWCWPSQASHWLCNCICFNLNHWPPYSIFFLVVMPIYLGIYLPEVRNDQG